MIDTKIRSVSEGNPKDEGIKKIIGMQLPVNKQVTKHGIYHSIIIHLLEPEKSTKEIQDITGAKEVEIIDHNNRPNFMVAGFRPNRLNVIINDEGVIIQAYYDSF